MDEITIKWHIDDIKSLDETLTDDQCREVLQLAMKNHDANIGINWDTLRYWINEIK